MFGCSSNANIEESGQQLKQLDEPQKEITPKQQLDSETIKEDTEISDDQNQKDQKLKSCKLSGGELVDDGWIGKDTGSNYCNQCKCMNGALACTKMACLDNDSSVKAPVRDVSQQDDSKAKSEEDERKKDDEERKEIEEDERKKEEDERKKEEANQPESNSKKDVKNKPFYENNCSLKPEIILKVYGDVEQHKIESAQKAIDNLDIVSSGIKVPVYVLLWEVNEERGLDEQNAELLTDFIISKFFPPPWPGDEGSVEHVREDIYGKVQKESITADYYPKSCAAGMFIAATNVSDFKNYIGKVIFNEYHHVWDGSFYANSPGGFKQNPAWLGEGMAEYDGIKKAIAMGWTDQNYLNKQISQIKSKLINNSDYIDLDKDSFIACDHCPVHSLERGIVAVDYIISNYIKTDFDTFANKYYLDLNKFGWEKALSNAVGDYEVFKNSFKQYVLK